MTALPSLLACRAVPPPALSGAMPMTNLQLQDHLALLGWTSGQLGRELGASPVYARRLVSGRTPVPDNVAAWLELKAAVWGTLSEELQDLGRRMGVDHGRYARHPLGMRPIDDEEAAKLEVVAAVQQTLARPIGWRTTPTDEAPAD